jgi:hypothetical protein
MNPKMSDIAELYLKEIAVLEDARENLAEILDDIWMEIDQASLPTLTEYADTLKVKVGKWDNKTEPGQHTRWLDGKTGIRFNLFIHDPRISRSGYQLIIECITQERAKLNRDPQAQEHFEKLAKTADIQPIKWNKSHIWRADIQVHTADLERTVADVSSKLCAVYKLFTEFNAWMRSRKPARSDK